MQTAAGGRARGKLVGKRERQRGCAGKIHKKRAEGRLQHLGVVEMLYTAVLEF